WLARRRPGESPSLARGHRRPMRRDQPDKVILVCHWQGRSDRFFGKYKSFETGKWLKIPGGAFPPAFDTKEKALMFAREWHDQAQAGELAGLQMSHVLREGDVR